MANPVNETISYQTHYVAASAGREGLRREAGEAKATAGTGIPGRIRTWGWQESSAAPRARPTPPHLRIVHIALARIVFLFPRRAKYY